MLLFCAVTALPKANIACQFGGGGVVQLNQTVDVFGASPPGSVALIRQMHARGEARRSSRDATAIRYEGDATPSHPIVSNRRANIFKYGRGIVVQLPAGRGAGPMRSDRGILSRRRRRGQSGVLRLVLPGGILRLRETSQEEWAE